MIQVNRIYLIFNRLVTKKFLVDTSDLKYIFQIHHLTYIPMQTVLKDRLCNTQFKTT